MNVTASPSQLSFAQSVRNRVETKLGQLQAQDNTPADQDAAPGSVVLSETSKVQLQPEGIYLQDVVSAQASFNPEGKLQNGKATVSSYYMSGYGPSRATETTYSKTAGPVKQGWFSKPQTLDSYAVERGSSYERAHYDPQGNLVFTQQGDTESGYLHSVKSVLTSPAGLGLVAFSGLICGCPGTLGYALASTAVSSSIAPLVGGAAGATIATLGLAALMNN